MKYRRFSRDEIEFDKSIVIKGRAFKLFITVNYNNPRKTITRRMWKWVTVTADTHGLIPDFCGKWIEMSVKDYKHLSTLPGYIIGSEILSEVEPEMLKFVKDLQVEVFDKLGHEV